METEGEAEVGRHHYPPEGGREGVSVGREEGTSKDVAACGDEGVSSGVSGTPSQGVSEAMRASQLWRERSVDSGYAVGYSTSKWACEVLLEQFASLFGSPVTVFRCGMILAHRRAGGQINGQDFFSRLLASVALTGVAPDSFYEGGRGEGSPGCWIQL